jgi:hypothetical protein
METAANVRAITIWRRTRIDRMRVSKKGLRDITLATPPE